MNKPIYVFLVLIVGVFCAFKTTTWVEFPKPPNWPKPVYDFTKNPLSEGTIELGRHLFYDPLLSKDSTISCSSCHSQYTAFTHVDHDLSHGIGDSIGTRNSPALMNLAWGNLFMWDGSINHLDMQALAPISHEDEMGDDLGNVLIKLKNSPKYPLLFAKAFGVQFSNKEGTLDYVWGTSWGVSTRLIGGLIMAHSDDDGLILPPKLAPIHVVIVPIFRSIEELNKVSAAVEPIVKALRSAGLSVKFDNRDTHKPGFKFAEYELKGVPVRMAIGPRDLDNGTVEIARRDTKEKQVMKAEQVVKEIPKLLEDIQRNMYSRALKFRTEQTTSVETWEDFKKVLDGKGGFLLAHWDGTAETEAIIKDETKATIRCIPLDAPEERGQCIYSGKPSSQRVLFARAY